MTKAAVLLAALAAPAALWLVPGPAEYPPVEAGDDEARVRAVVDEFFARQVSGEGWFRAAGLPAFPGCRGYEILSVDYDREPAEVGPWGGAAPQREGTAVARVVVDAPAGPSAHTVTLHRVGNWVIRRID